MALRVELPREIMDTALEAQIKSLERANAKEKNAIIKDARLQEINTLTAAKRTITDVK